MAKMTIKDKKRLKWIIIGAAVSPIVYIISTTAFRYSVNMLENITEIGNLKNEIIYLRKQVKKIKKKLRM